MTDPQNDRESSTHNIANLGATLAALARSPADRECLEVFANLVAVKNDALRPHLLTVLLEPQGTAQIFMVGHACPGLTLQLDADLEISIPQLWFNEIEGAGDGEAEAQDRGGG